MKFPIATAVAALTMAAATTGFAQSQPSAAATLPDAFDNPASSAAAPSTQAASAARTPSATDSRRSIAALRTVIAGFQSGNVDYDLFTEDLASQVREQADTIGSLLNQFGPLQEARVRGQEQGADKLDVSFEKQKTEWLIAFNEDGKIAVLLFRPAED